MSDEYNVKLLVKQTKLNAKNALSHNEKYSGFKDLLKDNIPESLVDYNGNAYDISSVFHDTNWSDNTKTPSTNSSQSNQKFSQIETNANLELYKNARLVPHEDASGTTHKLWTVYDDASNNLLEHMINYKFDNSGSYLPILTYHNGSSYVESSMFSDPLWWLIDYENHAISFFNTDSVLNGGTVNISASSANPPKLTFYRYIGKTKVNNKLSVEGDISCNEVIVSGTTLTSKLGIIDLSYSDLSGVVTTNIGNITSNTNNKAPINNPIFTGNVTCNNGLYVSQGSSTHLPIVFDNNFPKPAIQKVSGGLNFFHYLSGSPSYRDYDLFIKSDTGNVGIGTSSPAAPLSVCRIHDFNTTRDMGVHMGVYNSGGAHYPNIQFVSNHEDGSWIDFVHTTTGNSDFDGRIRYSHTNGFQIYTNHTQQMTIDTDGNVGIGTSDPKCLLNTNNLMTSSDNTIPNLSSGINGNNSVSLFLGKSYSSNINYWGMWMGTIYKTGYPSYIQCGDSSTQFNLLLNPEGGNVGIGTDEPGAKLDVNGDINCLATDYGDITPNNGYIARYDSTRLTHLHYFGMDTWGNKMYLNWYSQNDIITNGNVGIGTSSPGAKLDIISDSDGHCLFTGSSGSDGNKENIILGQSSGYQYSYSIKATGTGSSSSSLIFRSFDARPDQMSVTDDLLNLNRYGTLQIRGSQITFGYGQNSLIDSHIILKTNGAEFGNGRDSHIYIYRNGIVIWAMYCWGINNSSSSSKNVAQVRFSRYSDGSLHTFLNVDPYTGTVTTPANGATSDNRVKHNEVDISNSLLTIRKLKPVKYFKNTDEKIYDKNHNFVLDQSGNPLDDSGNIIKINIIKETGFISQEIKKIDELKHLVIGEEYDISGNKTIMGLNYNGIIPYNTCAIQEIDRIQQLEQTKLAEAETEITTLKSTVETQQTTIHTLQSTLAALEARITALENP